MRPNKPTTNRLCIADNMETAAAKRTRNGSQQRTVTYCFPSSCLVSNSISPSLFCDGCLLFSMSSMPAEAFDIAASVPALHSQCGHVCCPMQILTNNDTDIGIEPWRSTIRTWLPWQTKLKRWHDNVRCWPWHDSDRLISIFSSMQNVLLIMAESSVIQTQQRHKKPETAAKAWLVFGLLNPPPHTQRFSEKIINENWMGIEAGMYQQHGRNSRWEITDHRPTNQFPRTPNADSILIQSTIQFRFC